MIKWKTCCVCLETRKSQIKYPGGFCASEASKLLPEFVKIDLQDQVLPDGIHVEHLKAFQTLYREHCEVGTR